MSVSPKIETTCMEMFQQRNYKDITMDNEKKIITGVKSNGQMVCLFLETIQQFNVDKYQQYITTAEKMKIKHIILVCLKVTSGIQKTIRSSTNMDIKIETFHENELLFNITKHNLVPKHILLDAKESSALNLKYNTKLFPKMLKTDPICRFYNFPNGAVIKIIRKNGDIAYRVI
jgi:DNA-directed RNA polymerase I, II, and III subunit RPABC1